jgi:hypothetical protein
LRTLLSALLIKLWRKSSKASIVVHAYCDKTTNSSHFHRYKATFESEQESQSNQRSPRTTPAGGEFAYPTKSITLVTYCTKNEGTAKTGWYLIT